MSSEAGAETSSRARRARGSWIFAALCVATGVAFSLALVWLYYFPDNDGFVRRAGRVAGLAGGDYVNMFVGAHLALQGRVQDAFDLNAYMRAARALTSPLLPFYNWSYPPSLFLFVWPLALVPYGLGYAIWIAGGFSAFLAAVLPALRRSERGFCGLLLLLAPASILNIADGQNGFFTAGLLLGAVRLIDSRPYLAGFLFGLLTVKPQLGLLAPLILIALRRWTVIGAACFTTTVMVGLSLMAFGSHAWVAFFRTTSAYQILLIEVVTGFYPPMMPSVFVAMRVIGADVAVATVVQGLAFVVAASSCIFIFLRTSDLATRMLAFGCAALLATPYAFNYDMTATSAALLLYVSRHGASSPLSRISFALLWLTPALIMFLDPMLPVGPIGLALSLGFLVRAELRERPVSPDDGRLSSKTVSLSETGRPPGKEEPIATMQR